MQRDGMLDEHSRCKLCVQPVGGAPHICSSPLACSFVADFSAIYEPWCGLGQEDSARVRRLQGQVVVVMPEQAHFQHPARALETGELMLFQVPARCLSKAWAGKGFDASLQLALICLTSAPPASTAHPLCTPLH